MNNKNKNKRREILSLGVIAGAGAIVGVHVKHMVDEAGKEKVKLMTADGQLVEVDADQLPKSPRKKPISNAALKEWMGLDKNPEK